MILSISSNHATGVASFSVKTEKAWNASEMIWQSNTKVNYCWIDYTSDEYAGMYGITGRQAREDLSKMVMIRLLIREGKARLIRYRLYPEVSGSIRK